MTGLALSLALASAAYLFLAGPEQARLPPAGQAAPEAGRADAAAALLERLADALGGPSDDRPPLSGLAAPGDPAALRELRELRGNARRLGLTDLSLRYVDENAGRTAADGSALPPGQWVGDVAVQWRVGGFDREPSRMEVTLTFAATEGGAAFVTARADQGSPAPLWLLQRLAVARGPESLVMVAAPAVGGYARLAEQAVLDVRKVLPRWRGDLVVEVPASQDQLDRVLGSEDGGLGSIAAVTTPVDGSPESGSPVHVFVNPAVFDPLGRQGSQIVMSHEAAHVATGAATGTLPTWLLEGFADYVALAHVDLPVSVAAGQILAQVRRDGAPGRLPSPADFDSDDEVLGASYEAAWLACRLVADRFGERRLIRFYERADRDGDADAAFREVLGTSEQAFTRQWRAYLSDLAG